MQEKRLQIEGQDTPYLIKDNGTVWSEKRNRELKGTTGRNEYHSVFIMHNGKKYSFMVHRLVAEAFCDNPNNYNIVHHKDENKLNNCADNLEWVSAKENTLASIKEERRKASKKYFNGNLGDGSWKKIEQAPNYYINKEGQIVNSKNHLYLTPQDRNGYLRVGLTIDKRNKMFSLHRLLYETFIGPIPEGAQIDHIDGNRANNDLSNLRVVNQSENTKNAFANGRAGQIPILQYDENWNFIQEFPTIQAAADAVGRSHAAIRTAILRGGSSGGYYWKKKEGNI